MATVQNFQSTFQSDFLSRAIIRTPVHLETSRLPAELQSSLQEVQMRALILCGIILAFHLFFASSGKQPFSCTFYFLYFSSSLLRDPALISKDLNHWPHNSPGSNATAFQNHQPRKAGNSVYKISSPLTA